MALSYTAPTWTDGYGEGISATNLQAMSNCIEGLVKGTDKAVHAVSINGSVITLTYANGTTETFNAVNLKGIADVTESISGLIHTYSVTYTDGTTDEFEIKDGRDGSSSGDMLEADYDSEETVKTAGGITDYVAAAISGKANASDLDDWTSAATTSDGTSVTFSNLNDAYGYDLYCENKLVGISAITKTGSGTSMSLTYTLTGAAINDSFKLRILK